MDLNNRLAARMASQDGENLKASARKYGPRPPSPAEVGPLFYSRSIIHSRPSRCYPFCEATMKLRIRPLESKETLKIEIQSSQCSLQQLKSAIAGKISSPPISLYLSLNRKDELLAAPHESLQSIGLTSGDLVFYTLNPNSFVSSQTLIHDNPGILGGTSISEKESERVVIDDVVASGSREALTINSNSTHDGFDFGSAEALTLVSNPLHSDENSDHGLGSGETLTLVSNAVHGDKNSNRGFGSGETLTVNSSPVQDDGNSDRGLGSAEVPIVTSVSQRGSEKEAAKGNKIDQMHGGLTSDETPVRNCIQENAYVEEEKSLAISEELNGNMEDMEVDKSVEIVRSDSVPNFLRKVINKELDNMTGNQNKLLIISVHAAFLESGFVCFDSKNGNAIDGYGLPVGWAATAGRMVGIPYTLPSLINPDSSVVDTIVLRFEILGKYVSVYGSVSGNGSNLFHLYLDASLFVPAIEFVWSCDSSDGESESTHDKEVFKLWKIVKDKLSLPLLIGLCEKTGLTPPPCFMCLPTDLKLRILEFLPGVDVAKIACVCLELKYLSSNDDLWEQKFMEEFRVVDGDGVRGTRWKDKFAVSWGKKKLWTVTVRKRDFPFGIRYFPMRRPVPFGSPGFIIGGDYDRLPGFGGPLPFGSGRIPHFHARRFSPHGNLGGFNV